MEKRRCYILFNQPGEGALADELDVALWTASQSNKEGTNSEVINETNMGEAYGKAAVADVIITLTRKIMEKTSGHGKLFVSKNRAGKDGFLFNVKVNTARSKFEVIGDNVTLDSAKSSDESEQKAALKKKWETLQNDKTIKLRPMKDAV